MEKPKFKEKLFELFDGGGTNGGLYIDGDDADMLVDEIYKLVFVPMKPITSDEIVTPGLFEPAIKEAKRLRKEIEALEESVRKLKTT